LCVFHTFVDVRLSVPLKLFVERSDVNTRDVDGLILREGRGAFESGRASSDPAESCNRTSTYPLLSPHAEDSLKFRHSEVPQLLERVEVLVQIVSCACALVVARRGASALAVPHACSKLATLATRLKIRIERTSTDPSSGTQIVTNPPRLKRYSTTLRLGLS